MKNTSIVKNSIWGTVSSFGQNILYSLFFIILARKYNTTDFGNYILANTLYGMILSFSSLGLGQWYMRSVVTTENTEKLTKQFILVQTQSGIIFYIILAAAAIVLYGFQLPLHLALVIGLNVIFDNIIYSIKCINIISFEQHKTFVILLSEAMIKLLLGCILFIYPFNISTMVLMIVLLRALTLHIFLRYGTGVQINILTLLKESPKIKHWKKILSENWAFVFIGSISVIYWSAGNILVSKFLPIVQVSYYEISFKLFALAEIIPLMITTTLYPHLSDCMKKENSLIPETYKISISILNAYGVLAYFFVYSYSGFIIPFLFGHKYANISTYTNEMFLTMLIFPMSILQANLLVANRKEKMDMWLNIISLLTYLILALVGLYKFKNLSVINYSIFSSFLLFNLLQTYMIFRKQWQNILESCKTYVFIFLPVMGFYFIEKFIHKTTLFPVMLVTYLFAGIILLRRRKTEYASLFKKTI